MDILSGPASRQELHCPTPRDRHSVGICHSAAGNPCRARGKSLILSILWQIGERRSRPFGGGDEPDFRQAVLRREFDLST